MDKEAFEAVSNINADLFKIYDNDDIYYTVELQIETNTFDYNVKFLGDVIDEFDRKYNEETDEHEPLEFYLRRKMKDIVKQLEDINKL